MKLKNRISLLKSSAKARGIEVRIMDYEYENLLDLGCHYCGKNVKNDNGTCLDRVNSDKGYVLSNVVACCRRCNVAKNDMTFSQFLNWIEKVHNHTQKMLELAMSLPKELDSYKLEKQVHKDLMKTPSKKCIKRGINEDI